MLNLTGGGLSGGYRKYLESLVPDLQRSRAVTELLVVVPPKHEAFAGTTENVWSWSSGEHWHGYASLRTRVQLWKPDVVLVPTARYLNCGAPVVSMVRNMEPMSSPSLRDGFAPWAKNFLGAQLARRAVVRSSRVIAVSDFVRDFLVSNWQIDPGHVGVVYHGVDVALPVASAPAAVAPLTTAPFVFVAGSLLPYRGVEDAVRALPALVDSNIKLAVAGDGSATYLQRLHRLATELGVANRESWLGHLNNAAMAWAYQNCTAFLMTSRVEACPNTALEAMANGAMCVSTESLPMPEFFRSTALYYQAGNASQLATQVNSLLSLAADTVSVRRERARQRASDFTWHRTALGTIAELESAVSRS